MGPILGQDLQSIHSDILESSRIMLTGVKMCIFDEVHAREEDYIHLDPQTHQ
jgi:hypothetical protein